MTTAVRQGLATLLAAGMLALVGCAQESVDSGVIPAAPIRWSDPVEPTTVRLDEFVVPSSTAESFQRGIDPGLPMLEIGEALSRAGRDVHAVPWLETALRKFRQCVLSV